MNQINRSVSFLDVTLAHIIADEERFAQKGRCAVHLSHNRAHGVLKLPDTTLKELDEPLSPVSSNFALMDGEWAADELGPVTGPEDHRIDRPGRSMKVWLILARDSALRCQRDHAFESV